MIYDQYLYFPKKYLNEEYDNILNEMYFGKTPKIKLLEKLIQIFFDSFDDNKNITEDDLKDFKFLEKSSQELEIDFSENIQCFTDYRDSKNKDLKIDPNELQKRIILYIKYLLEQIFGISNVQIDFRADIYNMAMGGKAKDLIISDSKISVKRKILSIKNDYDIKILSNYVKEAIIVDDEGIRLNPVKCPISLGLAFPYLKCYLPKFRYFTAGEFLSSLLHEIGHYFSYFILPYEKLILDDNVVNRIDEKFADSFCAMYGYSIEKITKAQKTNNYVGHMLYTDNNFKNKNFILDRYKDVEEHPNTYSRLRGQLEHLKEERHSKHITPEKLKELNKQIKIITELLKNYKYEDPNVLDKKYLSLNFKEYLIFKINKKFNIKLSNFAFSDYIDCFKFKYTYPDGYKQQVDRYFKGKDKDTYLAIENYVENELSIDFNKIDEYYKQEFYLDNKDYKEFKNWFKKQHISDVNYSRIAPLERTAEHNARLKSKLIVKEIDKMYEYSKNNINSDITQEDILKYGLLNHIKINTDKIDIKALAYFNEFFITILKRDYEANEKKKIILLKNYIEIKYKKELNSFKARLPINKSKCLDILMLEIAYIIYINKYKKLFDFIRSRPTDDSNSSILMKHYNLLKDYIENDHWNELNKQIKLIFYHIDNNKNYEIIKNTIRYNIPFKYFIESDKLSKEALYFFNKFYNNILRYDRFQKGRPDNLNGIEDENIYYFSIYIQIKYNNQITNFINSLNGGQMEEYRNKYSEIYLSICENVKVSGRSSISRLIKVILREIQMKNYDSVNNFKNNLKNSIENNNWNRVKEELEDYLS